MLWTAGTHTDNGVTRVTEAPASPAADAEDLKRLLRIDEDGYSEDGYLDAILLAASEYAAQYLNRALLTTKLTRQYDQPRQLPQLRPERRLDDYLNLPYSPLQEVERIYTIDDDGAETEIDRYILDNVSEPARIAVRELNVSSRDMAFLRIDYIAGYGDTYESVPKLIQQGILQHAAYMYEHRGDCDAMEAAKRSGAHDLYGMYRVGVV